jgi:hypothetical protein
MNEPVRLLESTEDVFERELLASAQGDRGSPAALRRTLAAAELAAGVGLAATGASAKTSALAASAVFKWLLIGALSGTLVAVTGEALRTAPSAPQPVVVAPPAALTAPPARTVQGVTAPAPSRAPERARSTRAPERGAASAENPPATLPSAATPPPASATDLAQETRLLEEATRRVQRGDAAGALAALDRHRREHPSGVLRPEASVVRVRALVLAGRSEQARELLEHAERTSPSSAHVRAMQRALDGKATSP